MRKTPKTFCNLPHDSQSPCLFILQLHSGVMCGLLRLQHELLEVGQQLILAGHVLHQLSDQVEEILVDPKIQNL